MTGHRSRLRLRQSLFGKYLAVLFAAVVVPLLVNGISDAFFGYRDQRTMLDGLMRVQAAAAADKISGFLNGITEELGLAVQQPWTPGLDEQHRLDALRVLRQVPAIVSITLVDAEAHERVHVSRTDLNRTESGTDWSQDPAVIGARSAHIWYGPVAYYNGSEPFMSIAMAGNRKAVGVAIADVNLKFIWDVVSAIHIGRMGSAFVLDQPGRLIAHPDISRVLSGTDAATTSALRRLRDAIVAAGGAAAATRSVEGERVVAAMAPVPGVHWSLIVEQPVAEAFAPIYAALRRTGGLLLGGAALAGMLAFWLARRMTHPIRLLEEGTRRIGAGEFAYRIAIRSGDELEKLAAQFNQMAEELAISQERSERIARLKRFLAPQVAEIVEKAGDDALLEGQRAEVVVIFCDLRGFTALSSKAEPEQLMRVLGDYFEALGSVITTYEATVTSFSGDGLMAILNAPVPCADPARRGVEMATAMQDVVQKLIAEWLMRGHEVGFGVGIAMGWATVGRIGYESRLEYTAVGNVVNLAARLCASAVDRQILVDPLVAEALRGSEIPLIALGMRSVKGYDQPILLYEAGMGAHQSSEPDALDDRVELAAES